MNRKVIAFSGPSNSGKTTLIQKISKVLVSNYKVLIIKHDPKDKAKFDIKGKDSDKFFKTGADTVVLSPTRTTYFSHTKSSVEDVIDMVGDFDLLLIEGLKELEFPRISIFREKIDESYLPYSKAIAIDKSVDIKKYEIPSNIEILDLNDIESIIEWIFKNAKKV